MKYTKTVPYFKKGKTVKKRVEVGNTGKTKEEIKAEAEKNQSIERSQQAADGRKGLSTVGAGFKKPIGTVNMPTNSRAAQIENTVGKKAARTFGEAFQQARERGDSEFLWQGERYHTRTAEEEAERKANKDKTNKDKTNKDKTNKDKTNKDKTSAEVEQFTSPWITRPVTNRYGHIVQGPDVESKAMETPVQPQETPIPEQRTNREQHAIDVNRLPKVSWLKSLGWNLLGLNPGVEPVETGWEYTDEAGVDIPTLITRFMAGDKDITSLSGSGRTMFDRHIHNGDTTYLDHKGNVFPAEKLGNFNEVLASGDKEIWKSRGYQPGGINDGLQQQPNESVSAGNVVTNTINTSPQVTVDGNITTYREDNPYTGPRYYRREFTTDNTGAQVPIYFSGTDPENLKKIRNYALVNRGPHYRAQQIFDNIDSGKLRKQGGTINKLQRGNVLTNREQHLVDVSRLPKLSIPQVWGRKLFGTGPKPVETGRTHLNKAGEQVPEVGNRIIMPGGRDNTTITRGTNYGSGWLTSQRNIQRGDTTYVTPGGNAPSAADLPRYKSVFDNADKAIWKSRGYQQGGQVEQQPQMTEEDLVIDFTVRYFSALGVAPEDIMDQQGSLNPAYVEEITNVFQQGDIDWGSYMASPDEYIQQFVSSRMQMARKGTKLKRLSQLRIYKK